MSRKVQLEEILGYTFRRPELLDVALTHSSWANEHGCATLHNERQEFLGDAVIELCVSWELFLRFPEAREGELTRLRSRLVSEQGLAALAREMGLADAVRLGRGEESQGGRERDAILSDAVEAVLAAVFEDAGFEAARKVVCRLFCRRWPEESGGKIRKDYKTRLQELMQELFRERPLYVMLGSEGPEHAKVFHVRLTLPDTKASVFEASGSSLKRAEQEAARYALESFESLD